MKKIKLLMAGHDLKFAEGLIAKFKTMDEIILKVDKWYGHDSHDEEHSEECLEWADIILCEWGLGNAVWYSKNKKENQKLFVRMHRQELDTHYPKNFILENIDKIIAISPYIYEEFYRIFRFPREKMVMISNYVDMEKYQLNKGPGYQFNLGMIGISPKMKRIDLAIDIFEKLWLKDNRYKLFIKGKMPSEYSWVWNRDEQREYYGDVFERIERSPWKDNLIFSGYGKDVNEWLNNIGFILSMSDFESFHLAVAEGMASGAYPIIRNWVGAETIYKKEWIIDSVDAAVEKVQKVNLMEEKEEILKELRDYVEKYFSLTNSTEEFLTLIKQ